MPETNRVNLLNFSGPALEAYCLTLGQKKFRAVQLMRWIHRRMTSDFAEMTDLAKAFRAVLETHCEVKAPAVLWDKVSEDGTRKWLFDVGEGNAVETVFIPEDGRGTLCVSSQAGCAMGCLFCSTGRQGFNRNLTVGEILGQLWVAERELRKTYPVDESGRVISNVVLMGMGEPLQNLDNVTDAISVMLDPNGYALSRRRVTVSTCGLTMQIDKLAQKTPVALAISLHAPNDALRDQIMPVNKKHGIAEILAACKGYLKVAPRDYVTMEYILLGGVNDSESCARELVRVVKGVPCKFNLIPFNPFPDSGLTRPTEEAVARFQKILMDAGYIATVRKTRGDDIDAACGQLKGTVLDRTRREARLKIQRASVDFLKDAS